MTITPEKLREYAKREDEEFGFENEYARTFRAAADEIERLKATIDRQLTEMTQLKLAAMGWTKSSP